MVLRLAPLVLLLLSSPLWGKGRQPAPILQPWVTESIPNFAFRVLEDDQQGFYLFWSSLGQTGIDLMGQHIDSKGQTMWNEPGIRLIKGLATDASWDAIADSKGGVLLTWENQERIFVRRFKATSEDSWSIKTYAVSASTFSQKLPAIAPDGTGGVYVVWQEKRITSRWVLIAQRFNAQTGAPHWPEGTRVSLRPSDQQRPHVVYDGYLGLIVAWNDSREQASQLQAQRLDYQANRLWGAEGVVVTAPAGDRKTPPAVGAIGGGAGVIAWQASSGADRIFLQHISPNGKMAWVPKGLEVGVGNWHEWNPVLHGDGKGGMWIGWEDHRNEQNWQVFVHHLQFKGPSGWPPGETALTALTADQGKLALTDDGLGGILATWVDNRNGTVGIYAQEVNEAGKALLGTEGYKVADRMVSPQPPQIVSLTPGQAAIAWADAPSKGQWKLYWRRFGPFQAPSTVLK